MATTPIQPGTPAVGFFNPADGSDPNAALDPTNTAAIQNMIELGALTKEGQATLLSALRAAFGSLAAASASRQRLAEEIEILEADLEAKTALLEEQLEPALEAAIQARDAAQAALDAAIEDEAHPDVIAQLQANLAAAQNTVNEANAAVQQTRGEINQINVDIATKQDELVEAEQLSVQLEAQIAELKAQLAKLRSGEPLSEVSNGQLLTNARSLPGASDARIQDANDARFNEQQTDLNYATLTRVIENLVREALAGRGAEDLGDVKLDDASVKQALIDAGVDLAAYGLDGPGELPADFFQPIIDAVQVLVIYSEIDQLVAQRAALQTTLNTEQPQPVQAVPGTQPPVPTQQPAEQPVAPPAPPPVAFNTQNPPTVTAGISTEDGDNPLPALAPSPLQTSIATLGAIIDAKTSQARSLEQRIGVPTPADLSVAKDEAAPTLYTSYISLTGDRSETSFNTIPDVVPLPVDRPADLSARDNNRSDRAEAPIDTTPVPLAALQPVQAPPGSFNFDAPVSNPPRVYVGPV